MPCINCPNAASFKSGDPEHEYANRKLDLNEDGSCHHRQPCPWAPKEPKDIAVCFRHNRILVGCVGFYEPKTDVRAHLAGLEQKLSCRYIFTPVEMECDKCRQEQGDLFDE